MQGDEKGNKDEITIIHRSDSIYTYILYIDCVLDAMHIVFSYFAIADHGKGYAVV